MKAKYARREFLKQAGRNLGFLGLGSIVYDSVVAQFFNKACAQVMGQTQDVSRCYLHYTLPGGPPRHYFDLLLTPNGKTAQNFLPGGFGTFLEKVGGAYTTTYQVEKHVVGGKTIYLPPLWNMSVSGQDFASLLPNTAFIRGMDMEIDGHNLSSARQIAPITNSYTISGMVADAAKHPFSALIDSCAPATAFRSKRGLSANTLRYAISQTDNPVASLLTPFKPFFAGRVVHSSDAVRLQEQAFKEFERFAQSRGTASSTLPVMYDRAMDLMEQNVFDMQSKWATTYAKYQQLVQQAVQPTKGQLPGIFDQAIPTSNTGPFSCGVDVFVKLGDLRDMITADTAPVRMAANFAVAEILLGKLTSTMVVGFPDLDGVQTGTAENRITHDQHRVGSIVSTMSTTLFFRAFLACLTEQVRDLKARGLFDRTVIHVASEFNRNPSTDGSGSSHGPRVGNATLISGMIGEVGVVGNIQKDHLGPRTEGTFGIAMPYVLDDFNRPIQVNDVARTVTAMLGVDDIVTNGRSLLGPVNGTWKLRKPEANNV